MKFSEMDERQKKAYKNIKGCANWIIGELEIVIDDFDSNSEEFKQAKETLADHNYLVSTIYNESLSCLYSEGHCKLSGVEHILKDIRFCGKDFLLKVCEHFVSKMGY